MNTETGIPLAVVVTPASETTGAREETPPQLRAAIEEIQGFVYAPSTMTEAPVTLKTGDSALPGLDTGKWEYGRQKPNPISIIKARELLVTGYEEIPCELTGTKGHGYAWIADTPADWLARRGVSTTPSPPVQPDKEESRDPVLLYIYQEKMKEYRVYTHLIKEGTKQIVEWFGKDIFLALCKRSGALPVGVTPAELLVYLEKRLSKGRGPAKIPSGSSEGTR